jgi:hypothetical protein
MTIHKAKTIWGTAQQAQHYKNKGFKVSTKYVGQAKDKNYPYRIYVKRR